MSKEESRPFGVAHVPAKARAKIVNGRVYAGKVGEIPPGKAKAIALDKFSIAVFNLDGEFYAIKDACPHAEYPLSRGVVAGDEVTCASHNWRFNIKSGICTGGAENMSIRIFKVVLELDDLWIEI